MRKLITTGLGVCMLTTVLAATPEKNEYKADLVKSIYKKIGKTVQDSRKLPTFNFEYNSEDYEVFNAWYDPENNTINFGEGIYDMATTFGDDSVNVIAAVIAHEIAHFYKDHGWGYSFGMVNNGTHIADDIYEMELTSENRAAMEAEADYFGGIFCYMAGYNTLDVVDNFFEQMYAELEIPEETFGYPTKHDRIAIYRNTKEMLEELIPVFEAANYLTVLEQYDKATACYDHIISVFPSREMYNNAGVALAMQALSMYAPEELDYLYPFTLDNETRLNDAGKSEFGLKGAGDNEGPSREVLLEEALELFEKATSIDKEYAVGYVNQALVNDLLGEPEMADAMSTKAIKLLKDSDNDHVKANAHVAKGIALAHADEADDAEENFQIAMDFDDFVANQCMNVLESGGQFGLVDNRPPGHGGSEITSAGDEHINDLDPSLIEVVVDGSSMIELARQNENRPKIKIYSAVEDEYSAYYVKTYSYPKSEIGIVVTPYGYTGESDRGISVGDDMASVYDAYGMPVSSVVGSLEDFYVYQETGIIFKADKDGKVTGWALYGM